MTFAPHLSRAEVNDSVDAFVREMADAGWKVTVRVHWPIRAECLVCRREYVMRRDGLPTRHRLVMYRDEVCPGSFIDPFSPVTAP